MDYASDIDELGLPIRRKRRGDMSFMVIAIGTICIAVAWVMTVSDPYTEIANRVEVQPVAGTGSAGTLDLFNLAASETPAEPAAAVPEQVQASAEPVIEAPTPSPHILPGEEVVIIAPGEFIGPMLPEGSLLEASLGLKRGDRRAVQRRLQLSGYEPGPVDGVFGPKTREAITAYERKWGFPEDGFIDRAMLNSLEERSQTAYAAWEDEARKHRRNRKSARVAVSPVPTERQLEGENGGCARKSDGSVVGHQSVGCDLRGLVEGLRDAVRGRLSSNETGELEASAGIDR